MVSLQEGDCIATLHAEGRPIAYIAAEIGRDSSSVCHKLKRNGRHGRFRACAAQKEGG
ncbi:helix-turn-helix domain-containing protein [Atopobium sp. oral taxon 416]|uniref:helix-turn-helix domain-containing protein n=1 Tax=Atopobium sp. oral taxon 416 TaxID=712157 RepID=UPI001BADA6BD|nr:helix-turn-helix domain-containing protein [Atopobium sp. oral taxon 416]